MIKNLFFISIFFFSISCTKEDPVVPVEEELITTLIYTLVPEAGGTNIVLKYVDQDGTGGTAPTVTVSGNLAQGKKYLGTLQFLNESGNVSRDITSQITNEALNHQIFYKTLSPLNLTIFYDDKDSQGNPLGVKTKITANTKTSGKLQITLKHLPNKSATGASLGDPTNAGGTTDIDVTFNVAIQ